MSLLRQPLESVFHADPFIHVSTFGGAELGCKVACRVLTISSAPDFLDHVNRLTDCFAEKIAVLRKKHSKLVIGLRQLGLMMGLELKDELCGPLLTKTAYDNDLLMIYANNDPRVCQFLPPLIMEIETIDWIMAKLDKALIAARRLKPLANVKYQVERIIKQMPKMPKMR